MGVDQRVLKSASVLRGMLVTEPLAGEHCWRLG